MIGDAAKHVGKPSLWIDAVASLQPALRHGRSRRITMCGARERSRQSALGGVIRRSPSISISAPIAFAVLVT
jgi:hypothetical protein